MYIIQKTEYFDTWLIRLNDIRAKGKILARLKRAELSHTPDFGHSKNQTYFSHVFLEVFLWDQLERSMTGRLSESRCG
jgi:hypothetical protein